MCVYLRVGHVKKILFRQLASLEGWHQDKLPAVTTQLKQQTCESKLEDYSCGILGSICKICAHLTVTVFCHSKRLLIFM